MKARSKVMIKVNPPGICLPVGKIPAAQICDLPLYSRRAGRAFQRDGNTVGIQGGHYNQTLMIQSFFDLDIRKRAVLCYTRKKVIQKAEQQKNGQPFLTVDSANKQRKTPGISRRTA